jgi:hypothetical protein
VQIFCSEHKFNKEIKQGLFAILFQDGEQIVKECEKVLMIGFNKPFINPQALRALFFALKGSDFDLRRSALEDLNTTLIGSTANCNALQDSKSWQDWVWNLLTDIPKEKQDEKAKKLYGYAMNVFAVVHFQSYTQNEQFYSQVCDTLDSLYQFGGPSHQTYEVGRVVLLSIVNKLKASKKLFQTDDHTGVQWMNLRTLIELIIKFVFQTAHWRSEGSGPPIQHKRDASNMSSIDQAKAEEMKRIAEKNVGFILAKARVGSNVQLVPFTESQEFGVHFSESGKAGDVKLLQTFLQLFEELHLDKFDQDTSGNLAAEDVSYLKRIAQDYQFFQDSVELLDLLNRTAIDDHLITWRKVANVAQRHVAAGDQPKTRKAIREEVRLIVTGQKPMGQAPKREPGEGGKSKGEDEEEEDKTPEPKREEPTRKTAPSSTGGERKGHQQKGSAGSSSVAVSSPTNRGSVSKRSDTLSSLGGNVAGKKEAVSKMDDNLKRDIKEVGTNEDVKTKMTAVKEKSLSRSGSTGRKKSAME